MIKLFGAKLNFANCIGIYLVLLGCPCKFVFDWMGNRRKEICGSGR